MRLNLFTYGIGASILFLGGCRAWTAAGGVDGITVAAFAPKIDGAHTLRIDLDGDKAEDRQYAEFMCDVEPVEDMTARAPAFDLRCDLADVSKGLEKSAFFESGCVPKDSDEAQYNLRIDDSRAEEIEVTVRTADGTEFAGSMPMVEFGDRDYPNGRACDDEGYRSANVELDLELQ